MTSLRKSKPLRAAMSLCWSRYEITNASTCYLIFLIQIAQKEKAYNDVVSEKQELEHKMRRDAEQREEAFKEQQSALAEQVC